jgi:hypothetical protein
MTTTRYFYAARWPWGGRPTTTTHRRDANGHNTEVIVPACQYVRFTSAAARDAWVSRGLPYMNQPGYREAVSTSRPSLARAIRWAQADLARDGYTDARCTSTTRTATSRAAWSRRRAAGLGARSAAGPATTRNATSRQTCNAAAPPPGGAVRRRIHREWMRQRAHASPTRAPRRST